MITQPSAGPATTFHAGKQVTRLEGTELAITGKEITFTIRPGAATKASCKLQLLYKDTPIGSALTFHWQPKSELATKALFQAVEQENIAGIREAMAQGVDLNKVGENGFTPLQTAIYNSQSPTLYNSGKRQEIIELLISQGASLETPNIYGNAALQFAVYYWDEASILTLLNHGANINTHSTRGNTLLHDLCSEGPIEKRHVSVKHESSTYLYPRDSM